MSKLKACVGAVALVCAIWFVLKLGEAPRVSRGTEAPGASGVMAASTGPKSVKETLTVPAGQQIEWTFKTPSDKMPGHLHGHWDVRGKSAGIEHATDDTLVSFTLRGPDDRVIEKRPHPTSGNFDVHFTEAGSCTFTFGNQGIIRGSDRDVIFDGVYEAD